MTTDSRGLERPEQRDSADDTGSISRRDFFKGAGAATAASSFALLRQTAQAANSDGTPEQVHLTWGDEPTRVVFVSWASPAQAVNPRVLLERPGTAPSVIHAVQRVYTDGLNGQTVFTYHARLDGLAANSSYRYSVTADNEQARSEPDFIVRVFLRMILEDPSKADRLVKLVERESAAHAV